MSMMAYYRRVSADLLPALETDESLPGDLLLLRPPPEVSEEQALLLTEAMFSGVFSAEQMAALRENPRAVLDLLQNQASASFADDAERLLAAGIDPERLDPPFELEKAWHGVHVVLAGTLWEPGAPPANAVLGGRPLGEDCGYGPVRVMSVDEVAATAAALRSFAESDLRDRLSRLDQYGGEVYALDPEGSNEKWILDGVHSLCNYFREAADARQCMLVGIV